jgi:ferrous iron transport protein B
MNAEMKSAKWLWGGIGLQLAVGYSVSYFVYTIGTLVTDAASLNVGAAIAGLAAIIVMASFIVYLCISAEKKLKAEYELKAKKKAALSAKN